MNSKNILLIEPGYPNKYPPLGLMKIAAYHGPLGRNDRVKFVKGNDPEVMLTPWDRIYVTTLFSFEWKRTADAIDFAIQAAGGQKERVFVGGIAASLMHDQFLSEPQWAGVRFIKGLLDGPPASALQLSAEEFEFGADDTLGTPIEELVPDYSILDHVDYLYPVHDAYFGYASRGCVRKCSFCGVPQLEGAQRDMPPLTNLIKGVNAQHGEKKDLVLMDNNITAAPKYREVIAEIVDLGFETGATMLRDGKRRVKRRVDFNQGVDARILCKSPMFLREMSRTCISPLRIAFDHIGVRKQYETAIRMAAENQILSLSNYMLYNFVDTPEDLYQRMALNIVAQPRARRQDMVISHEIPAGQSQGPLPRRQELEPLPPPVIPDNAASHSWHSQRAPRILHASLRTEPRGIQTPAQLAARVPVQPGPLRVRRRPRAPGRIRSPPKTFDREPGTGTGRVIIRPNQHEKLGRKTVHRNGQRPLARSCYPRSDAFSRHGHEIRHCPRQ